MATDRDLVNFSEPHELNGRLRAAGLRQTEENRSKLTVLGKEVKQKLGKRILSHDDLKSAIDENLDIFD